MTGTQDAQAMLRLLNGLARKGAYLEPFEDGFVLALPGAARRQPDRAARLFARDVVNAATQQAWIAAHGNSHRLTEVGALALHSGLKPAIAAQPGATRIAGSHAQTPRADLRPVVARAARRPTSMPSHQMEAAERIADDFQTGQMVPRVTSNWDRAALGAIADGGRNPSGRGVEISERISGAQERVRRALADAGPEFADVLIDLCCLETGVETFETKRGWPRRSAKLVLSLALERLARHYGIIGQGPRHGRTQRWGSRDYRPT
jgi:Domain of unknown function (DUF6456)